jgi:hypothetical protein
MILDGDALAALLAAGCPACRGRSLRARALYPVEVRFLDGEPVSAPRWRLDRARFPERIYRVECADCCNAAFERDDCPLCRAPGGLARALEGRNGLAAPPKACPRCQLRELDLTAEIRMHAQYVQSSLARRVADAESHEPAWHTVEAACPDCEEVVARAPEIRCVACGRSSLVKRPG